MGRTDRGAANFCMSKSHRGGQVVLTVSMAMVLALVTACGGTTPVGQQDSTHHEIGSETPLWAADIEFELSNKKATLIGVSGTDPLGVYAAGQRRERVFVALARTGEPSMDLMELRFDEPTGLAIKSQAAFGETAGPIETTFVVVAVEGGGGDQ